MKITTINRETLRQLEDIINAKLVEVSGETGLAIKWQSASFLSTTAIIKLSVGVVGENGEVSTKEADDYRYFAPLCDLPLDWLGKSFHKDRREYTVRGYLSRSKRMPILCERDDGKQFKFPIFSVREYMAKVT